jgi:hypothetical protein
MSRFRTPLLILGLGGAVVVAVAVTIVVRVGRGTPVHLPVAIHDIPPDTPLDSRLFRLQEVRCLDQRTLDAFVTADEFGAYVNHPLLEMVHAGFPVGKAQVQIDPPNGRQQQLTLLLSDDTHLVYPLRVTPDQVGNYLVAGDRVDVVFTVGRVANQHMSHRDPVTEPDVFGYAGSWLSPTVVSTSTNLLPPLPGLARHLLFTTTVQLPAAKAILTDVLVLRVEREEVRSVSSTYGMAESEEQSLALMEGEVIRLYLEVDRDQAELLSFALHNGALNLPARARPAGGTSEGVVWEDFVDLFFAGRSDRGEEDR